MRLIKAKELKRGMLFENKRGILNRVSSNKYSEDTDSQVIKCTCPIYVLVAGKKRYIDRHTYYADKEETLKLISIPKKRASLRLDDIIIDCEYKIDRSKIVKR